MRANEDLGVAEMGRVVGWSGDRLAVTDPQVLRRLTDRRLSASTAASLQRCPARWVAEKLLPRRPDPFGPAEVGTAAHAVLERLYGLPPGDRTPLAAIRAAADLAGWMLPVGTGPAVRDLWLAEVHHAYQGIFAIEDPAAVRTHRTEWRLDADVAGIPFTGYVDRARLDADDRLILDDFKSGGIPWNPLLGDPHGDQLRLYVMAVEAATGERPVSARALYVRHGRSKRVATAADRLRDTAHRFTRAAETLADSGRTGVFATGPPRCADGVRWSRPARRPPRPDSPPECRRRPRPSWRSRRSTGRGCGRSRRWGPAQPLPHTR